MGPNRVQAGGPADQVPRYRGCHWQNQGEQVIKIVLDTNVFVSSFFGGNPRKIVDLWKTGEVTLCLSKPLIDEYVEVLRRLGLAEERELDELLGLFARGFHVLFAAKTPELHVVEEDPDDDKFIECAVALKAAFIVSGDKNLVAIREYLGIETVAPREFLARYKPPSP
jgi:putative PIN family toxin of toxin-antitoxin system